MGKAWNKMVTVNSEDRAILEDLNKFLNENGIKSEMQSDIRGAWIRMNAHGAELYYYIDNVSIYFYYEDPVVSLADPQYRERCLEHCVAQIRK